MKSIRRLVFFLFSALLMSACGGSNVNTSLAWKPEFLPVRFVINSSGVNIEGDSSIVTPLGEFSVGASYNITRQDNTILVIVRDRKRGAKGFDSLYQVRTEDDQLSAIVNGKTLIEITNKQVLIDVTEGRIDTIQLKRVKQQIREGGPTLGERWSRFWDSAPFGYHPFALTRWAYDDATISRWYGLGFLWFLVRLVLAIVLIIPDILLTIIFGIGTTLLVWFGTVARNIFYGIVVLIILFILGSAA